ncbi:MAG: MerR family DNA-binding protein [Gammaproteobacteria bacterium]|nr:MerR family DNA-binding protein [Gammaproteobacteria bacterium]
MKVNQLAKATGVSADTVRHYVRLGLIRAVRDPQNGYRFFPASCVQRLKFIKTAQQLGFKLQDIQLIFADAEQGDSPCPRVRELIAAHIEESAVRIRELRALQARMQEALLRWDRMSDGKPDGHSVCRLIESLERISEKD